MKKTLWALSALALVGFTFAGCGTNCETADDCEDGQYCIETVGGVDANGEELEAGEMICSDCPVDCAGDKPVCNSTLHICTAVASCPNGQVFDSNGVCVSGTVNGACTSDKDCEDGMTCNAVTKSCETGTNTAFKYVRIDDLSAAGAGHDPGADIDAIVLDSSIYATAVIDFKRSDGTGKDNANKHFAADPTKAIGKPDSLVSYPATGSCNYFKSGSNSAGNKACDLDSKDPSDACDYDYSFVSLGGEGGYLIVEMGGEIKAGSKLDVVELGDCALANTAGGSTNKAKAEEIKVSVAIAGKDADWKVVGNKAATGGIASFTVSENMLK